MQPEARKAVDSFFDAVNRRDWGTAASLLADDFSWTEPFLGEKVGMGKENLIRDAKSFVENIPDTTFVIGNLLAEGHRAGFELTAERKEAKLKSTYALFVEVSPEGKLRQIREYYDPKMLMKQLGLGSE